MHVLREAVGPDRRMSAEFVDKMSECCNGAPPPPPPPPPPLLPLLGAVYLRNTRAPLPHFHPPPAFGATSFVFSTDGAPATG